MAKKVRIRWRQLLKFSTLRDLGILVAGWAPVRVRLGQIAGEDPALGLWYETACDLFERLTKR